MYCKRIKIKKLGGKKRSANWINLNKYNSWLFGLKIHFQAYFDVNFISLNMNYFSTWILLSKKSKLPKRQLNWTIWMNLDMSTLLLLGLL